MNIFEILLFPLFLNGSMKLIKIILTKLDNFIKSKKVLKSSSSIIGCYLFLIWYLFKPSRIISTISDNLFYKVVVYLYEILPLLSYLILLINAGIQLKIGKFKYSKKLFLSIFYILNFLTLPFLLRYAFIIIFS